MTNRDGTEKAFKPTGVFRQAAAMDLQELLDAQLKLQVDVSFKTHHDFLVRHGLGDCRSVLDVGTGNGYFCGKLAQLNPHISFLGVDFMKDMLQIARDEARRHNRDNVRFMAADLRQRPAIAQAEAFDGMLLRYTAYHIKEISRVLEHLKTFLKPGGRIWIIDEEFDYMGCEPAHEAFSRYKRGTMQLYDKFGSDYHCGSKVPSMLTALGYRDVAMELDSMSNKDHALEDCQRYMIHEALLIHRTDPTTITAEDMQLIREFVENVLPLSKHRTSYGHVMISAVK